METKSTTSKFQQNRIRPTTNCRHRETEISTRANFKVVVAMENKQKKFAIVFVCSLFLLISFTEGAFIGQQTITNGLSPPNLPNYPFYFENLLHLLIGVKNGPIGAEAVLAQYNSGGTIARNVSFPLPCLSQCTIEGALFGLVNNSAFFSLRREDSRYEWSCMIYQIDLTSFQIINSSNILNGTSHPYTYNYCTYSLPIWSPYNSTHCIFYGYWFEYSTLTYGTEYTYINPSIGGSSTALSDQNLIIFEANDGYNQYFVTENVETSVQESIDMNGQSMMVFLGDNSTNVAITTSSYEWRHEVYNISLVDATAILKAPNSKRLNRIYPQTGLLGDSNGNLFFLANTPFYEAEKGVLIEQYNVDVASNSHTTLDELILVDYQSFPYYPPFFSVLSWGLNGATQQFAIVTYDVTDNFSLQLIDYDNSPSSPSS